MACNPFIENAVAELRLRKSREGKPFALMFRDIEIVKEYLQVSNEEEDLITSWRKPIVLLKIRKPLAPVISPGLASIMTGLPFLNATSKP